MFQGCLNDVAPHKSYCQDESILGYLGFRSRTMENQMDKNMQNDIETGNL